MNAREEILDRVRAALADSPEDAPVPRTYRRVSGETPDRLVELFAGRLADYRATVHHPGLGGVAETVAGLPAAGATLAVPPDVPAEWLAAYRGRVLTDDAAAPLSTEALDGVASVLTGCATAVAETGTIVLDGGPAQGRRALTLIPDHHICVVSVTRLVGTLPEALARLVPTRPLTLISGPSATSDIELDRVEGVHGPRRLDVVLMR